MKTKFALTVIAIVVSGCSSKPDCGSKDAEKLVSEIIGEKNLLGNVYQNMFTLKNVETNLAIDQSNSEELNKLTADLNSSRTELSTQIQQCIQFSEKLPEVTNAAFEIQQLKLKISQADSNPPKLEKLSDAEMLRMNSQQSTLYRKDQEFKYSNSNKAWSKNIDVMNRDLEKKTFEYNESLKFSTATCSVDKANAVNYRPNPDLSTKVNGFASKYVEPINFKILKINEGIAGINKKKDLVKEEKTAKDIEAINKNIKNAILKLENVITLSKDKNTDAVTCRAGLKIDVKDLVSTNATIYYNLEKTSKGDLYATITNIAD